MSTETLALDKHVLAYLRNVSVRETPEMVELRQETAAMPESRMQISAEQGQFMGLLIRMMGAERAIEIGSFTGYSGLCIAGALPAHGTLVACDVSVEWTDIARRYWQQAGLQERIDLRLAPGLETLASLLEEEGPESFDFVFIDAIKTEYAEYYEAALALIRPGGVIAVDNVLWSGLVADPSNEEEDTVALRAFNEKLSQDMRIDVAMVPIGDGLTLACKRG